LAVLGVERLHDGENVRFASLVLRAVGRTRAGLRGGFAAGFVFRRDLDRATVELADFDGHFAVGSLDHHKLAPQLAPFGK